MSTFDELRSFAAGDAVVTTGTATIEPGRMMAGHVRPGVATDPGEPQAL